jgi:hypothetical protein
MKEQHIIKNRIKPPFHSYPPSSDIPRLPEIKPEDAVAILKSRNWSARVIKNRHITCLRQIITPLLESDSLPQDFDQVVFENVVIEQGDLTELEIPFKLYFSNAFFLGGLHLNQSRFTHLDVSGYIGYALSLTETKGQPIVNLANLQADQIYVYEGEGLDCFDISTSTIGRLTLASTTIKRHITLHDNVDILDGLWLENLSIEQEVNLRRCAVQTFFRIHNVSCSGNIQLVVCDLNAPLSTRSSSCTKLSLSESNCSRRLDFRNLSFQELDVSNATTTGQLLFNLNQLQRKKDSVVPTLMQPSKWDIPPCLSPQRSYTLNEPVSIAEQLILLRENFQQIPTTVQQEQYCAYQLMDEVWKLHHPSALSHIPRWFAKWAFGFLLLPMRILRTMAILIGLYTFFYSTCIIFCLGNLVFSDGQSIFHDGVLSGLYRTLYFSVVTFSTLGYGDIYPVGFLKALAATEAFIGLVVTAIFAVSLARKLFRW